MQKLYLSLILIITISFVANPGLCAGSSTTSFKLCVTIPQMITLPSYQNVKEDTQITGYASQIVQEEQLKRDNRLALVKSIVAR
jgi:hypothetical protein